MALLAFLAEIGMVDVVSLVTGMTIRRRLFFIERSRMAAFAFRFPVIPLQRVFGVPIMIEQQDLPTPFGVTARAILAESAFVDIVFFVARVAIDRRLILIEMSLVAGVACDLNMPTVPGILRVKFVVECDGFPFTLRMAGFTLLSITAFMLVVLLVTGIAVHRGIFERRG